MTRKIRNLSRVVFALAAVSLFNLDQRPVMAADHLDAPAVTVDGSTDINDIYVFQSPQNSRRTVLVMTVNPAAGVISGTSFNPTAVYRFNVDFDGNAFEDVSYSFRFTKVRRNGSQGMVMSRWDQSGNNTAVARTDVGQSKGIAGGGRVVAGLFEDPFFFDFNGFNDGFNFTGEDFFAGLNVSAIVFEVPRERVTEIGNLKIGVWAETKNGPSRVIDRMGRPAINTVLLDRRFKNEYNESPPHLDRMNFFNPVRNKIRDLSGDLEYANMITPILLPDILTFDAGSSDGFLNGRKLGDDVIDAELSLLTKGGLETDGVDSNDVPFLNSFPFLAPAN